MPVCIGMLGVNLAAFTTLRSSLLILTVNSSKAHVGVDCDRLRNLFNAMLNAPHVTVTYFYGSSSKSHCGFTNPILFNCSTSTNEDDVSTVATSCFFDWRVERTRVSYRGQHMRISHATSTVS
jgi:hypothetical protein